MLRRRVTSKEYISSKKCSSFSVQATLLHEFDCSRFDASTAAAAAATSFTIVVIFVDLNVCCSLIGWYCEDFKTNHKKTVPLANSMVSC